MAKISQTSLTQDEILDHLFFPRGVLLLLKETGLFGPEIDKALEDMDYLIQIFEDTR